MGTKEEKILNYQNLWIQFEKLLDKEDLNLSSFAKKWEKYHQNEDSDYKVFYNKVKQQKKQLKIKSTPQPNTVSQVEEYIKFLDNGYFTQELLEDEKPKSWFN